MLRQVEGFRVYLCSTGCRRRLKTLIKQGAAHQGTGRNVRVKASFQEGVARSLNNHTCAFCQKEVPDNRGGKREKVEREAEPVRIAGVKVELLLQGNDFTPDKVQKWLGRVRLIAPHDAKFSINVFGNFTVAGFLQSNDVMKEIEFTFRFRWAEVDGIMYNRKWLKTVENREGESVFVLAREITQLMIKASWE